MLQIEMEQEVVVAAGWGSPQRPQYATREGGPRRLNIDKLHLNCKCYLFSTYIYLILDADALDSRHCGSVGSSKLV